MSGAYYNENNVAMAAWLRELIRADLIAPGDVDTRSIEDVRPIEIRGYTQCHFFAGIGGWSRALRLAGWPDDQRVWTGSCPCQPFSGAGSRAGFADKRHLWPSWLHLISQCGPPVVVGEQVASTAALLWWDLVSADLEGQGYACAAADIAAAGVGAPHIRQRLYWVADAVRARLEIRAWYSGIPVGTTGANAWQTAGRDSVRDAGRLAYADGGIAGTERQQCSWKQRQQSQDGFVVGGLGNADSESAWRDARGSCAAQTQHGALARYDHGSWDAGIGMATGSGPLHGFWRSADWLACRDGRWRPVEPGAFPLAHGLPARMGRLRGYGNAIVAELAAQFIGAYLDARAAT